MAGANPFRSNALGNTSKFKTNFEVLIVALETKTISQIRSDVFLDAAQLINQDVSSSIKLSENINDKNGTAASMDIIRIFDTVDACKLKHLLKRGT